jgi:hypothetical protein
MRSIAIAAGGTIQNRRDGAVVPTPAITPPDATQNPESTATANEATVGRFRSPAARAAADTAKMAGVRT